MAIDILEFTISNRDAGGKDLSKGLKANKGFTRFLYTFMIEKKKFRKLIDISSATQLGKADKITRANNEAREYYEKKAEELDAPTLFDFDTRFESLATEYIKNKWSAVLEEEVDSAGKKKKRWRAKTKWGNEKIVMLEHYIYPHLKGKKTGRIKETDIDDIRVSMENRGVGRQNKDGCSPRTIRKVLNQVLKPILEYGYRNGALRAMPEIDVPKKPNKKKVTNGSEKLTLLYKTINDFYADSPFYRALFLFALSGRRWNEIRTLEWTDIDFGNKQYTIRAENSKVDEDKTFALPDFVAEPLEHFRNETGYVFTSQRTRGMISTPKKQIEKLRVASGIEELTLHYFRHILATALGESGMVNTVLSASLGHNNSKTVDDYYRTANTLKGSQEATKGIQHIVEVEK